MKQERVKSLNRIAARLARDTDDLRHTVLDVADDFLAAVRDPVEIPERLRQEVTEIAGELESIRPRFASHRTTSDLFDRQGLGRAGRERAGILAQRMIAVAQALARAAGEP